jgi:hypothetical protein
MQNSLKRSKTTYDTSFMIAYAMGVRGVQYDNVPASTLSDWNNTESFDHIYGYDHMKGYQNMILKAEQIRLLKRMIFSLVKLMTVFQTIVNTMPHKNRQLYQVRELNYSPLLRQHKYNC